MFYKILLAVIALFIGWIALTFFQMKSELFKVYDVAPQYTISAPNYDLTIVEFILYDCPLCIKINKPFQEALKKDGKIRYIPRPIAFEDSHPGLKEKVLMTYAAAKQGKFKEVFDYFISQDTPLNDEEMKKISLKLGLDMDKLKQDMQSEEANNMLKQNEKFFLDWDLKATPAFLMGEKAIFRIKNEKEVPTADEFLKMFGKARSYF